jgi:hypothetical protein
MVEQRPYILTNSWGADMLPKKYYDRKIKFQDGLNDRVDDAITKLLVSN